MGKLWQVLIKSSFQVWKRPWLYVWFHGCCLPTYSRGQHCMVSDPQVTFRRLSIKSLNYDWNPKANLSGLGIWCGSLLRRTWDSFSLGSLRCSAALRASHLSCPVCPHFISFSELNVYAALWRFIALFNLTIHLQRVECFCASVEGVISTLCEVNNKAYEEWVMVCSCFYAAFYCGHFMSFLHSILFLNIGIIISSLVTRFLLLIFVQISNNLTCSIILSWCPYLFCVSHGLNIYAYSEKKWKIKSMVQLWKDAGSLFN